MGSDRALRLSRRQLIQASVAAVAAPAPRPGELLPSPDFTRLRAASPYLVGVRPHRRGGVRLELEEAPLGGKRVVHNYGHGGGGLTLAFGCASAAADLARVAAERARLDGGRVSFAVLGTGAIGLTTAAELRRRWPRVPLTVYARDLDVRATTSHLAAGAFDPSGIAHEHEPSAARAEAFAGWLRASRERLEELVREGRAPLYGVAERKSYTLDSGKDAGAPFRRLTLPFERLRVPGREYSTWLINPTVLLPRLAAELAEAGVRFQRRSFDALQDVAALPERVVVNCTGYGARRLFGDERVVPQRGHLVALQKTHARQAYFFSGGACDGEVVTYVFCRQDDIVVGGTVQEGQDAPAAGPEDAAMFQKVVTNAGLAFAGQPGACRA